MEGLTWQFKRLIMALRLQVFYSCLKLFNVTYEYTWISGGVACANIVEFYSALHLLIHIFPLGKIPKCSFSVPCCVQMWCGVLTKTGKCSHKALLKNIAMFTGRNGFIPFRTPLLKSVMFIIFNLIICIWNSWYNITI